MGILEIALIIFIIVASVSGVLDFIYKKEKRRGEII
jgi:hypothetical protein